MPRWLAHDLYDSVPWLSVVLRAVYSASAAREPKTGMRFDLLESRVRVSWAGESCRYDLCRHRKTAQLHQRTAVK